MNQIEVENSSQFKEPVKELLENIENYYKKYGKLDLPIRVAVGGQKYLLKDNYAQYVVASNLKLQKVNAICIKKTDEIQRNQEKNLSEQKEEMLSGALNEEERVEQQSSDLLLHISCIYKEKKNKCYNINCVENVGKRCVQEGKCAFYIAATEKLSELQIPAHLTTHSAKN